MQGLLLAGSGLNLVGLTPAGVILKSSNAACNSKQHIMIRQGVFQLLCNLPVAVPPETEVILKVTPLSISPSVMIAHTSLKASFSLGVVYSLAVKATVIPVCNVFKEH
jgi:hypothetical protein